MIELRFPLDPTNPGQFYACCGLIELFTLLKQRDPLSHFDHDASRPKHAEFVLAEVSESDLSDLVGQIASAKYTSMPDWKTEQSIRPIRAEFPGLALELDWWLDEFRLEATPLKCWAGQVTSQRLFEELPKLLNPEVGSSQIFHFAKPSKSKFGVDSRSAWNALDFGYSPNEHGEDAATFPAVEMLAAFGLQSFRPFPDKKRSARYSLWRTPLPRLAAIQASLDPWDGLDVSTYCFQIDKRGSYKYFAPGRPEPISRKDNHEL